MLLIVRSGLPVKRLALLRLPSKKFTSPPGPPCTKRYGSLTARGDVLAGIVGLDFDAKLESMLAAQYGDAIQKRQDALGPGDEWSDALPYSVPVGEAADRNHRHSKIKRIGDAGGHHVSRAIERITCRIEGVVAAFEVLDNSGNSQSGIHSLWWNSESRSRIPKRLAPARTADSTIPA